MSGCPPEAMSGRRWALACAAGVGALSLPYWLPDAVVNLRKQIFAWVNGDEGIPIPGEEIPASQFKQVYGHPAANGRSRGAGLSDLFWYWLAPGPQVHQEHLEPGPRYDDAARTTRLILTSLSKEDWAELVGRCTGRALDRLDTTQVHAVRLRDLMMPIWAEVFYEVVFRRTCPPQARDLIVGNARDVLDALKCTGLRHMDRRARLTEYLRDHLTATPPAVALPASMSAQEQIFFLQGAFFNTAVVQMSEAMAHLLLEIAVHGELQDGRLSGPEGMAYLDRLINDTLWRYPLFGVAHRITSADIPRENGRPIPAGSVVLFDYTKYHHAGQPSPPHLDPDRWLSAETRPDNFIPFGVTTNRPCPARGFAAVTMQVATQEVLDRFALMSSAAHTRSLPNRAPCLLIPRTAPRPSTAYRVARPTIMRLQDQWESVPRSLTQLVLGSYMVWDARRQKLCQRYFDNLRGDSEPQADAAGPRTNDPRPRSTDMSARSNDAEQAASDADPHVPDRAPHPSHATEAT